MSFGIRMFLAACLTVSGASGCASNPHARLMNNCDVERRCELEGNLTIISGYPYISAQITTSDGQCIPLVIDRETASESDGWDERVGQVSGVLLRRGDESVNIPSIQYRDRILASGACPPGPYVLYVETIQVD